ncbi:EF-hand domain-containing protein [Nitrosococcus wardiae]|uniref:EF-hand domain-containing protein n=2 Tax=Nitrosococcus wardiae TaxID=1814290 RepID=A0A4P7C6M3_9GAMM|nr:EF-hand domain-containing protein [Nitrosococcus wardiae]
MTEPEESTAGQETQPSEREADKTMTEKERMEKEQPSFSQLDTDGNDAISQEEAQAFDPLALYFREFDRNQDDKIDSEEFRGFKALQMRGFDHGGDSTVEYGEKGALSGKQEESTIEQPSESESERMEKQQ